MRCYKTLKKIIKYAKKMKKFLFKLALKPHFSADSEYPRISDFGYPIRHFSSTYSKLPNSPEASGKLMVGDLSAELILTGDSDSW